MTRVVLFAAVVVLTAIGAPISVDATEPECPPNQDIKHYFNVQNVNAIKWDYVSFAEDLPAVLKNKNHMIVVDLDFDGMHLVVSKYYRLQDFLGSLLASGAKKGVKYNIRSKQAFERLVPKLQTESSRRSSWSSSGKEDGKIQLTAFPQWFHLNVLASDGQPDYSIIADFKPYLDNRPLFDCYTFSFGWGSNEKCSRLNEQGTENDITKLIEITDKFRNEFKNLEMDISHVPEDPENLLGPKFDSFTFVTNAKNIHCTEPKTLQKEIEAIKKDPKFKAKLLLDVSKAAETHMKLCSKNKGLFDILGGGADLADLQWTYVENLEELDRTIDGHVALVHVVSSNPENMFLGTDFDNFWTTFLKQNKKKGLLIEFGNEGSYESFWRIEVAAPSKITQKIPFGIKNSVQLGEDYWGTKLNYGSHKWLDCYSNIFQFYGQSGGYTLEEITDFKSTVEEVKATEKTLYLELDRVLATEEAVIKTIFYDNKFKLSLASAEKDIDLKPVRRFLGANDGNVFLNIRPELHERVLKPVLIEELVPDVVSDPAVLEFQETVSTLAEWEAALGGGTKTMIQVNMLVIGEEATEELVVDLKDADNVTFEVCLKQMDEWADHGIKLYLKSKRMVELVLEKKSNFKYLNFPIWLHLDVLDLTIGIEALGHQLVLDSYSPYFAEIEKQTTQLALNKIIYAIHVYVFNRYIHIINGAIADRPDDNLLIWSSKDDFIISKDFRENINGRKFFFDIPNKLILQDCPADQDVVQYFDIGNDLSQLRISGFVQNQDELIAKIGEGDMVRAKIRRSPTGELYVHNEGFGIKQFFKTFVEQVEEIKKQGIIFSFESADVFNSVMAMVAEMKTLNNPTWFDIEIPREAGEPLPAIDFQMHNDPIDCRTILVGLTIEEATFEKYEQSDVDALKNYIHGKDRVYGFRAEFLRESVDVLSPVFETDKSLTFIADGSSVSSRTKELRELVQKTKRNMFFDFPDRYTFAMDDCPENRDFLDYFAGIEGLPADLRKLSLSDVVKSTKDVSAAVDRKHHILKAVVTLDAEGVPIIEKDVKLIDFLTAVSIRKELVGLKLTFATSDAFNGTITNFEVFDILRHMERPIWISAEVVGEKAVDLSYDINNDLLDCRTLSLGWAGDGRGKYAMENIQEMKEADYGSSPEMYFVELVHLAHAWKNIDTILLNGDGNKNLITLVAKDGDQLKVIYQEIEHILSEHTNLFVYDMPDAVMQDLKGGCGSVSSSLTLAVSFAVLSALFY